METKDKVFYAIDMGSPTKKGGFFCWRWKISEQNSSFATYSATKGWNDCIKTIAYDSKKLDVYLAIEAPLWGAKDINGWKQRFEVKIDVKPFKVVHWYMQSGAAVGLMAQIFLRDLEKLNPKRKINLYESYITGLKGKSRKPPPILKFKGIKSSHTTDALESLMLLVEHIERKSFLKSKLKNNPFLNLLQGREKWINFKSPKYIIVKPKEKFSIGVLNGSRTFNFAEGTLLITKRFSNKI